VYRVLVGKPEGKRPIGRTRRRWEGNIKSGFQEVECGGSPNIFRVIKSRRMRWTGHVARIGDRRGVYRVLVGKPETKRPIGRTRRRWEGNIKTGLQEVECGVVEFNLVQERDRWQTRVNSAMSLRVL